MTNTNPTTLDRLNASASEECPALFCGKDRKTAELMRVSAEPLADGLFELHTCWGPATVRARFTMTRTFTKAQYAAEWIDAHLVPFTFTVR